MRGTVSRLRGFGVGVARLVLVSSWNVVDMGKHLASPLHNGKALIGFGSWRGRNFLAGR